MSSGMRVTPAKINQVLDLVGQGMRTPEIVKITGLSRSTIYKIRQQRYDEARVLREFADSPVAVARAQALQTEPEGTEEDDVDAPDADQIETNEPTEKRRVSWCARCRCHVYPPCQLCRTRNARQRALSGARRSFASPERAPSGQISSEHASGPRVTARLKCSVAELGLPVRLQHRLQRHHIETVNDLLHRTPQQLLRIPDLGPICLEQIYRALERLGFRRAPTAARS